MSAESSGRSVAPLDADAIARSRERALAFVAVSGDELARRRARALAGRAGVGPVVEWLAQQQLPDGGFPDPAVRRAAASLAALADCGALHGAWVESAVGRLVREQRADGSWVPEGEESEGAALEATGRIAGLLARTACARASTLDAAADWLAARFAPERVQGFAYGPLAAYAATFANVPHEAGDAILQWCGRELERGFRAGAFDAARTARVLLDCDAPSLPGARLAPPELVAALLLEQSSDGGWPAPAAASAERVARTLDALAALAHLDAAGRVR